MPWMEELEGDSPQSYKESDMIEMISMHTLGLS